MLSKSTRLPDVIQESNSRSPWHRDFPSFDIEVESGDRIHRITWRGGRLVLHDHDIAAEEVLRALGGQPCPCLVILELWRDRIYAYASAIAWQRTQPAPSPRLTRSSWARVLHSQNPASLMAANPQFARLPAQRRAQLLAQMRPMWKPMLMQSLPAEMHQALAACDSVRRIRQRRSAARQARRRDADKLIQAYAAPALEASMRKSRRDLRSYATITVVCWKVKPGEPPTITGNMTSTGGFASVFLPASWLNRVGIRGLANVDGNFITEVDQPAPASGELAARAVCWERQIGGSSGPTIVGATLTRALDGGWSFRWD